MARPFNTDYPLGKRMRELGLNVDAVFKATGINYRKLSNMLANRIPIAGHDLYLLSEYLDCDPADLAPETEPEYATMGQYVHKFPSQTKRQSAKSRAWKPSQSPTPSQPIPRTTSPNSR